MADQTLLKGIRLFKPKPNQPEFVIAGGAITLNELVQFGKDNPALLTEYNGQKQIKIQILRSKDGNPYIAVDTWQPTQGAGDKPGFNDEIPVDDPESKLPF